jgi:hypothetical protein
MMEQSATLTVARRSWERFIGKHNDIVLPNRPAEGDLLYFPLTGGLFEIKFVDHQDPFYQLKKLYVYRLQVELFQYASERIETGNKEIDVFETLKTFDVEKQPDIDVPGGYGDNNKFKEEAQTVLHNSPIRPPSNFNTNNPFDEYERYARKNYPNKTPFYLILDPSGKSASKNWQALSYTRLIQAIRENLGHVLLNNPFNKWLVFLREFLITLENYAGSRVMDTREFVFVEDNLSKIMHLTNMKDKYVSHLKKEGQKCLEQAYPHQTFSAVIDNWDNGKHAVRIFSTKWTSKTNIVLHLSSVQSDKVLGISFYVYGVAASDFNKLDAFLYDASLHQLPWLEANVIRGYRFNTHYAHFEEVKDLLVSSVDKLNQYFSGHLGAPKA